MDNAYNLKLLKVLEAKVNKNDTRVTKAMKKLYALCVDSDYVRQNGGNEMRVFLKTIGLKFYPDTDQDDFVIKKYFEEQPFHAIYLLLRSKFQRGETYLRLVKLSSSLEGQFASYEDLLYEMNQAYRSSNVEKLKEEYKAIALKQSEFYDLQVSFSLYVA